MNDRIINLRTRRKQKARADAKKQSDANAATFGQPKSVRDLAKARADQDARRLDRHKRDPEQDDG